MSANQQNQTAPILSVLCPLHEVEQIVALKRSTIYALIADPNSDFPRPIKIGTGRGVNRWVRECLINWIQKKIQQQQSQN